VHFIKPNTSDNSHEGEKKGSQEDKVKNEEVTWHNGCFHGMFRKAGGTAKVRWEGRFKCL
jgi:hypothetical protein